MRLLKACAGSVLWISPVWAAESARALPTAPSGMTLWQLLRSGGLSMLLLGLISIAAVAFVIYFFITLRESRLVPLDFSRNVLEKIAGKKYPAAKELSAHEDNLLARIVTASIDRQEAGVASAREAVEVTAKSEVSKLWESLSYLSDIAVVAPLVGLLGTVLGMIDSFNVIAFSSGAAKPVLLAGGIAKAMVCTATGLIIAIPASIFYSFFRARVFKITNRIESFATEVVYLLMAAEAPAAKK